MPIGKLDHYSIRTLDIEASRGFYTEIMGFQVGYRPEFNFPGLWLYNDRPYPDSCGVVHIIGVDLNNPEGLKEYLGDRDLDSLKGTGTVDHMAFAATGLADMRKRLERHKIACRERTVPSLGLHQVFPGVCRPLGRQTPQAKPPAGIRRKGAIDTQTQFHTRCQSQANRARLIRSHAKSSGGFALAACRGFKSNRLLEDPSNVTIKLNYPAAEAAAK